MADPISISGLILAVVGSIGAVASIIDRIQNAPHLLQTLRSDLAALKPLLSQLDEITPNPGQSETFPNDNLSSALQQCKDTTSSFEISLSSWTKRSENGKLAWKDGFNIAIRHQGQIRAFQQHLVTCKQSLTLSIVATSLSHQITAPVRDADYANQVDVLRKDTVEADRLLSNDIARIDGQIRELVLAQPVEHGMSPPDPPGSAIEQLQHYKAAAEHFHKVCSESIPEIIAEIKVRKQEIRNVHTSTDSTALVGSINELEGTQRGDQVISDINTETRSFAIVGTANNIDVNQMFANMSRQFQS